MRLNAVDNSLQRASVRASGVSWITRTASLVSDSGCNGPVAGAAGARRGTDCHRPHRTRLHTTPYMTSWTAAPARLTTPSRPSSGAPTCRPSLSTRQVPRPLVEARATAVSQLPRSPCAPLALGVEGVWAEVRREGRLQRPRPWRRGRQRRHPPPAPLPLRVSHDRPHAGRQRK